MDLFRTALRASTVALLKGATEAGDRVFPSRFMPTRKTEFPAVLVYTLEEDMERNGSSPPQFEHTLTMVIDVRVEMDMDAADAADDIDALSQAILNRLLTNPEWVRQAETISAIKRRIVPSDQGQVPYLAALIGIVCQQDSAWEPVIPNTLDEVRVGFDCIQPFDPNRASAGPDGRSEAAAVFTIPTD